MNPAVGFLFPGQGSQSVGMGKALFEAHSELKQVYAEAAEVLGYDIADLCFNGPAETLNLTEHTQPALLVSSVAALRVFEIGNDDVRSRLCQRLRYGPAYALCRSCDDCDATL